MNDIDCSADMYTPLLREVNIKLIHLLPGAFEDDLEIVLMIHDADEAPEYEALSYDEALALNCKVGCSKLRRRTTLQSGLPHGLSAEGFRGNVAERRGHHSRLYSKVTCSNGS